jgi:hypothetical protein
MTLTNQPFQIHSFVNPMFPIIVISTEWKRHRTRSLIRYEFFFLRFIQIYFAVNSYLYDFRPNYVYACIKSPLHFISYFCSKGKLASEEIIVFKVACRTNGTNLICNGMRCTFEILCFPAH